MDRMRIMIVEDDLILAMGLEQDLTAMGYEIVGNESQSEQALKTFLSQHPDLILMDIDLVGSELDGIELAREIKKIKDIPIIFLSALGGSETIERAKEVNPSYYLIKPCNKRQLQIAIDFALSNFIKKEDASADHSLKAHEPLSNIIFARNDFFFIKKDHHYYRIDFGDVIFVRAESPGNNIRIFTDKEIHFLSIGLKQFEEQIGHPYLYRIHRSYLINIEKMAKFSTTEVSLMIGDDQLQTLNIGRTYRKAFADKFLK